MVYHFDYEPSEMSPRANELGTTVLDKPRYLFTPQ